MAKWHPRAWTDVPFRQDLQQLAGRPRCRGQRKNASDRAAAVGDLDGLALADPGLQSEDEMVRLEAAVALGDMGDTAESAVDALEELLTDPDSAVRQAVVEAIEKITAP